MTTIRPVAAPSGPAGTDQHDIRPARTARAAMSENANEVGA